MSLAKTKLFKNVINAGAKDRPPGLSGSVGEVVRWKYRRPLGLRAIIILFLLNRDFLLGRRVKLRPDWENVKNEVMRELLMVKFGSGKLREWLLATGDEKLVEGNTWHDNYWGSCICPRCRNRGRNELGKTLMAIRQVLRDECRNTDEKH